MNSERLPVIVGVGDLADRPSSLDQALEPLRLMIEASRLAEADAGGSWLTSLDEIAIVNQIGWGYADLPGLLKKDLGAKHAHASMSDVGGEKPIKLMMQAAVDIAAGRRTCVLIVGGESLRSVTQSAMSRSAPEHWTVPDPSIKPPRPEDYVTPLAVRYGMLRPVEVYPLYENATRAAWEQSLDEAQSESASLWSAFSRVAAQQPAAWVREPKSAEEIATTTSKNRPICFPYSKLMVAQIGVNQGAAFIVTSVAEARRRGVPEDRWVYVWSGAGATESSDFFSRDRFDRSTAMNAVLTTTLAENGLSGDTLDALELYSCFPCVPKMARRQICPKEGLVPTVAGGLTFFGGPANNYMTHAVVAMVRDLRGRDGNARGLLYGQGEFVTKHHAAVLARSAPSRAPDNLDVQKQAEAARGPVPALLESYSGDATIETFTVMYGRGGDAERAVLVARTPTGERVVAEVPESEPLVLAELTSAPTVVGRRGTTTASENCNRWAFAELTVPHLSVSGDAVLFERVGPHVAVVSLNRPAARNAVNGRIASAIADLTQRIDEDPELRVAVLISTSTEFFCAGADLNEVMRGRIQQIAPPGKGFAGFVDVERAKPWIAAVSGFALGGGTEIALACDIVLASQTAQFGLPEVQRGLLAAAGGLWRLPRAIPPHIAREFALTGDAFGAQRAYELGLVSRVVEPDQLRDSALAVAHRIADNAPISVRTSLRLINSAHSRSEAELKRESFEEGMSIAKTKDAQEGPRAFFEKRKPRWTNR